MKRSREGVKVIHGIVVNDLKVNIYELKKEYEVHVIFSPSICGECSHAKKDDVAFKLEEKLDGTINYLADEGYFDKKKKIKVIGMAFRGRMDNGSFFNSND